MNRILRWGIELRKKSSNEDTVLITDIADNYYIVETKYGMEITISINIQNNYELVPNKFDINTLKPFDNCKYSLDNGRTWKFAQYWYIQNNYHINDIEIELWQD